MSESLYFDLLEDVVSTVLHAYKQSITPLLNYLAATTIQNNTSVLLKNMIMMEFRKEACNDK